MSVESDLFTVGVQHHDALLRVLDHLEQAQTAHPDDRYPEVAIQLQASVWEFLKAFGRRALDGGVDEDPAVEPVPWEPSAAQLAAQDAGLPIPADERADHG